MTVLMRAETYLVLGAAGFIGRHLVEQLIAVGANVLVFGRNLKIYEREERVVCFEGEFGETQNIEKILDEVTCVFHLINTTSPATAHNNYAFDATSNLVSTLWLLDACRRQGVNRIVFASSGGTIYGDSCAEFFSETTVPSPISSYGATKLAIENYLYLYNYHYGMRNISLRVANPYGPYQTGRKNQGVIGAFMRAAYRSDTVTVWGIESVRDYIFVEDVACAFIAASRYDGKEFLFNIGTGVGRKLREIIDSIETVTGLILRKEIYPARDFDVSRSVLDIRRAQEVLGWAPVANWTASLNDTWKWVVEYERRG